MRGDSEFSQLEKYTQENNIDFRDSENYLLEDRSIVKADLLHKLVHGNVYNGDLYHLNIKMAYFLLDRGANPNSFIIEKNKKIPLLKYALDRREGIRGMAEQQLLTNLIDALLFKYGANYQDILPINSSQEFWYNFQLKRAALTVLRENFIQEKNNPEPVFFIPQSENENFAYFLEESVGVINKLFGNVQEIFNLSPQQKSLFIDNPSEAFKVLN
jgi:hypothetical protein